MESGADLRTIQLRLGQECLKDTALYLHLSRRHLRAAVDPLDQITLREFQKHPEPPAKGRGDAATLGWRTSSTGLAVDWSITIGNA